MPKFAPDIPTTQELQAMYPQTPEQRARIDEMRLRVSHMLGGHSTGLMASIGPCAMTKAELIMKSESERLARLTDDPDSGIVALYREPDWKPRTRPEDWHGLMTTDPQAAYRILTEHAANGANVAVEISADPRHLKRDSHLLTLAWKGGRNDQEEELTQALASHNPNLPIAIKNGLSGDIEHALIDVEEIERIRAGMGARAILLFRGGNNAQTPDKWEREYLHAHELTNGRLLVDWAHGGEQAHDPKGEFQKSVLGQIACMNHTIEIAQRTGKTPAGIFTEASDAESPTDPVMPFDIAIEGVRVLAGVKRTAPLHMHTQELSRVY